MAFQIDWTGPDGQRLHIYDDDVTGYAYWFDESGCIVGDVWLYNVAPSPDIKPWKDELEEPPYLNPKEYVLVELKSRPAKDEIESQWIETDGSLGAIIFIDGKEVAIIRPGDTPGRSRLVSKNGPLAGIWSD